MSNEIQKSETGVATTPLLRHWQKYTIADVENAKIESKTKELIKLIFDRPRIIENEENARRMLRECIIKTVWDSGVNMSEEDQEALIASVLTDVMVDFKYMTADELRIAWHYGVRKIYGDYMGINTATFYNWTQKYLSGTRLRAVLALKTVVPTYVKKAMSEEEKQAYHSMWLKSVYAAMDKFIKTGEMSYYDTGNLLYNYLDKLGLLPISVSDKEEIWKRAKKHFQQKMQDISKRSYGRRVNVQEAMKNLEAGSKDETEECRIIARHMAVKQVFEYYKIHAGKKSLQADIEKAEKKDRK